MLASCGAGTKVWVVSALLLITATTARSAELVTDEATRLGVLRVVFPSAARISVLPTRPDNEPFSAKDPLGHIVLIQKNGLEHQYEVIGPVTPEEQLTATDITDMSKRFDKRQVRMEIYRWRSRTGGEPMLVAVLDYSFANANPARCCRAIGKILLLSNHAERVLDSFDKMPNDFSMFTSFRFLDVEGNGKEKLIVGADAAGVAYLGIKSAIFDVSQGKLTPLLSVDTLVFYEAELENTDIHTLTLDERQTVRSNGKRFFFIKETFADKGKLYAKPLRSRVSYTVGYGLPLDWQ